MSLSEKAPEKPVPHATSISIPFWSATANRKLTIQFCRICNEYIFYPRFACGRCLNADLEWRDLVGKGVVYSYSVVHRAPSGVFSDVPYVVGLVDLVEGVRMMTNIRGEPEKLKIGAPVAVHYEARGDASVPVFWLS